MDIGGVGTENLVAPTASNIGPVLVLQPAERELIRAVKAINQAELFGSDRELTFVFDRETHRALVRIIDRETKEVITQIPPEHALQMARELLTRVP